MKIDKNRGYYLPLFNKKGLRGSISPFFGGSLSFSHHHYLLTPISDLGLYEHKYGRNVIFRVNDKNYFLNGNTIYQQNDKISYDFGLLYQIVERKNDLFTLETTSFIPINENLEIHLTKITNNTNKNLEFDIITNTLLYARSADNLHDHRHVTSLLNRVSITDNGILLKPTLSFDERGHLENNYVYSFFASLEGANINRFIPNVDDFLNGGSFDYPRGIDIDKSENIKDGYETMAAIGFDKLIIKPSESKTLIFTLGIHSNKEKAIKESNYYLKEDNVLKALNEVKVEFKNAIKPLSFEIVNDNVIELLKWVSLQPILRRYFGNSFLPHHDYGHGGRGWRDLWQDLLSLIMYNDKSVKELLFDNFAGVRIDGSNATIIGDNPGEFKSDRNQITRVWSDHGAWPLLTTKMYIDETGDINFLNLKQRYFQDQFTHYTYKIKTNFEKDNILRNKNGIYEGTILEHLLLQNIVGFMNVGDNGFVKLEDADWNDGLDMAKNRGETIAFTSFYTNNLLEIVKLLKELSSEGVELFSSLKKLIFEEIKLDDFFESVSDFDDNVVIINKNLLINQLEKLAFDKLNFINQNAYIKDSHYQSYYDNDGNLVDTEDTVSLTGQTMALLNGVASQERAYQLSKTTHKKLFTEDIGGYRLNSNYNEIKMNLGRAYGFAYGHKENGAVFSHMAMMYSYGLYTYNITNYARLAYMSIINKSLDPKSNFLQGIPEYFNEQGVGMYPFLTGSATWLLKVLRDQVFGINLNNGVLNFNPKLDKNDFINHKATIKTYLFGNFTKVTYINNKNLNLDEYEISKILINNNEVKERLFKSLRGNVLIYLDKKGSVKNV